MTASVPMQIGSLFSGAGGLDLAAEVVFGGRVVWQAEINPAASKVLAHRFPDVPNLGDITAVEWGDLPAVDVLCGGFPCQDVSAAGKRAGIKDGTRSGLWAIFAEAIDALRPQYVVIENVRGLLSATAHRTVDDDESGDMESVAAVVGNGSGRPVLRAAGAVLGDLATLGYDAQWTTLAAAAVGAPHRRERVFVLAADTKHSSPGGRWPRCGEAIRVWQTGGAVRHSANASNAPGDGRDEGRPESAGVVGGLDAAERGDGPVTLLPTPNAQDGNGGGRFNSVGHQSTLLGTVRELLPTPVASRFPSNRSVSPGAAVRPGLDSITERLPTPSAADGMGGHLTRSGGRSDELLLPGVARAYGNGNLLPTPTARDHKGPNQRQDDSCLHGALLPTHAASDSTGGGRHPDARKGHSSQIIDTALLHGTTAWGKYGPAIARWESLTRPAPSPTEPNSKGNPRLAAAFSEWMMGWPAGWVTAVPGVSRNDALRIVGNGVCPQQAAYALRLLLSAFRTAS